MKNILQYSLSFFFSLEGFYFSFLSYGWLNTYLNSPKDSLSSPDFVGSGLALGVLTDCSFAILMFIFSYISISKSKNTKSLVIFFCPVFLILGLIFLKPALSFFSIWQGIFSGDLQAFSALSYLLFCLIGLIGVFILLQEIFYRQEQ